MDNTFWLTLFWNKLGNRKIQVYSILCILLYFISVHLYWYFGENFKMSLTKLSLNFLISILLGAFVSGILLFFWQQLKNKKNSFLNQEETLNIENFIRIYIIYYAITIPIGIILQN
jgi:hypothetical protein